MSTARVTNVAVVGGGILGCSAALHLKLFGWEDVTLLERDRIGAGTSRAGAGLLARWSAGFVPAWGEGELELEAYGLGFYRRLAADGYDLGHEETGTVFIALAGPAGRKSLIPFTRHVGADALVPLAPAEVEEITYGFVRAEGLAGAAFDPNGASVAADRAARAVARRCSDLGGVVVEHEPVRSARRGRNGGFVLETATGQVRCTTLVVAAGAWTNAFLEQFGAWLPIVPLVATRLTTQWLPLPAALPAIQCCDGHRVYMRADRGRLVWGCNYEGAPRYALVEREPPDRLDGLDMQCVEEMRRAARALGSSVPALAAARTSRAAHGAPCFTPDLKPLIGEVRTVPGLYVLAGDNYAGVTHAPGAGRLLAELVAGAREHRVEADRYRPDRFDGEFRDAAEVVAGMRWTATRSALAARAVAS